MGESQSISILELVLAGMLGMFVLALGVVFFFVAYQRRLFKQQEEHRQIESDYQKELLRANLKSQEKERNRIGKDLHDGIGAMLTTSKLYFSQISNDLPPEKFEMLKSKVNELLEETIANIRRISHDLKPAVLENLGLVKALESMTNNLNGSGEIDVRFTYDVHGKINKEEELSWYRILQELVNNTLKHAQATHIHIHMYGDSERLEVEYNDDGIGISKKLKQRGLGLRNIESRLNLMKGKLEFVEQKEKGVKLVMVSHIKAELDQYD